MSNTEIGFNSNEKKMLGLSFIQFRIEFLMSINSI